MVIKFKNVLFNINIVNKVYFDSWFKITIIVYTVYVLCVNYVLTVHLFSINFVL